MKKPKSLLEFSYEQIKDKILTGEIEPGQKIKTQELSKQLNVSHTPVKEACNRLVAEGFIHSIPMQGYFVTQFTVKDFLDMTEVRIMMESFAIQPSIEHHLEYPKKLKRIETLLKTYDHPESLTYRSASKLEHEFHTLMIELSGNNRLATLYRTDWSAGLLYYFYQKIQYPLVELAPQYRTHRQLYEAMLNHDPETMQSIILDTMTFVTELLVPLIEKHDEVVFLPEKNGTK